MPIGKKILFVRVHKELLKIMQSLKMLYLVTIMLFNVKSWGKIVH